MFTGCETQRLTYKLMHEMNLQTDKQLSIWSELLYWENVSTEKYLHCHIYAPITAFVTFTPRTLTWQSLDLVQCHLKDHSYSERKPGAGVTWYFHSLRILTPRERCNFFFIQEKQQRIGTLKVTSSYHQVTFYIVQNRCKYNINWGVHLYKSGGYAHSLHSPHVLPMRESQHVS